jgi:hypothetical protein
MHFSIQSCSHFRLLHETHERLDLPLRAVLGNKSNCAIAHTFRWRDGIRTALRA